MNRSDAEKLISDCIAELKEEFDELDSIALHNQEKVLDAFRKNAVQARHFGGSTGGGVEGYGLRSDEFRGTASLLKLNPVHQKRRS